MIRTRNHGTRQAPNARCSILIGFIALMALWPPNPVAAQTAGFGGSLLPQRSDPGDVAMPPRLFVPPGPLLLPGLAGQSLPTPAPPALVVPRGEFSPRTRGPNDDYLIVANPGGLIRANEMLFPANTGGLLSNLNPMIMPANTGGMVDRTPGGPAWPSGPSRESLMQSACTKAAGKLRLEMKQGERSAAASEAFDKACYTPVSEQPGDGAARPQMAAAIGFLTVQVVQGEQAFCTATRIKATRLLTARHCFFSKETNQPLATYDALRRGLIRLYLLNDLARPLLVQEEAAMPADGAAQQGPIPTGEDHILLSVLAGDIAMPAVVLASATLYEASFTIGINGYLQRPDWRQKLRWSADKTCVPMALTGGCVVHGCHTSEGFSGAPIIAAARQAEEPIRVVGVHSHGGLFEQSCRIDRAAPHAKAVERLIENGNTGVLFTPAKIAAFQR